MNIDKKEYACASIHDIIVNKLQDIYKELKNSNYYFLLDLSNFESNQVIGVCFLDLTRNKAIDPEQYDVKYDNKLSNLWDLYNIFTEDPDIFPRLSMDLSTVVPSDVAKNFLNYKNREDTNTLLRIESALVATLKYYHPAFGMYQFDDRGRQTIQFKQDIDFYLKRS